MPLKIYKRPGSNIWHYRGTVGHGSSKRLVRRSTRTVDKTTAQRIASEVEARHWKGALDGAEAVLTFADAVRLYRDAQKATRYLARLVAYWKDAPVKHLTAGAVRQSAIVLYPNVSGATRNRQVIVPTQAIINHASELELCPRMKVKRFPVTSKVKEPAWWTWVEAFQSKSSPHLGALAAFMFLTGARISEALSISWADVDVGARTVKIKQGKLGGKERISHLPSPLVVALANIPGERTGRVFRYASRSTVKPSWDAAIKRAGIKRLTPHCCRHGFATAMLQAGVDVVTVAKLGGWASPALVLSTYGHAVNDATLTDRIAGSFGTPAATPVHESQNVIKKTI